MAQLTTGATSGAQTTTQSPQAVPAQTVGGASKQSGSVQPGTTATLLTSQQGISLNAVAPTTVSLTASTQSQASSAAAQPAVRHHTNSAIFIVPVILCLVAIGFFWVITRSAKNTTD